MKKFSILFLVLVALATFGMADPVQITPTTPGIISVGFTTPATEENIFTAAGLWEECLELFFKVELAKDDEGDDIPGSFEYFGSFVGSYTGQFGDNSGSIEWKGDPFPTMSGSPLYLLVKDGAAGHYIIDLGPDGLNWNGTDKIELSGFYPTRGAISHLSIFGCEGTSVPEPGTLTLLGMGILVGGLAWRRRG